MPNDPEDHVNAERPTSLIGVALLENQAIAKLEIWDKPQVIPGDAVLRRFGDASLQATRSAPFAQAWLVGKEAKAILEAGIDQSSNLKNAATYQNKFRRLRHRVGLVAAARDALATQLQIQSGLKTVFYLPAEEEDEQASPPFWLVYALRQFKWPGEIYIQWAEDPKVSVMDLPGVPDLPCVLIRPVLGMVGGTYEKVHRYRGPVLHSDPIQEARFTPRQVMLALSAGHAEAIAPPSTMLPMEHRKMYLDPVGGKEGQLVIHVGTSDTGSPDLTVHIGRGRCEPWLVPVGWIDAKIAPFSLTSPYVVEVEIDVWGRLFVEIRDPQSHPLPIRVENDKDARTTQRIPVYSLLFPRKSDADGLLVPKLLGATGGAGRLDSVSILEQTSFNGRALGISPVATENQQKPFSQAKFWLSRFEYYSDKLQVLAPTGLCRMELANQALNAKIDIEDKFNTPFDSELDRILDNGVESNDIWAEIHQYEDRRMMVLFERDRNKLRKETSKDPRAIDSRAITIARLFSVLKKFTPPNFVRLRDEFEKYGDVNPVGEKNGDQ